MEYVFTDSGCELPETYEYLDRIRAVLNIDITVVKSERDWDSYWSLWKTKLTQHGHYTYLPSPKQRWCTEVLKLIPYETWLLDNYPNTIIHSYVGLRADEKRDRSGFTAMKGNVTTPPICRRWFGIRRHKRLLIDSGLGFQLIIMRTNQDVILFYQTKREWLGLYENPRFI